jgi:ATP-binding cassette subfamily C protein CydD
VRPLDPRLLTHAAASRRYLGGAVGVGVATGALIIVQASLLADMLTRAFLGEATLATLRAPLIGLACVLVARAFLSWAGERAAYRASAAVKSQLRHRLVEHAVRLGPQRLAEHSEASGTGSLAVLATRGLDALDGYFARYLPQLVLAVLVPLAVGIRVLVADLESAIVLAVTLPLIPIFMILVGMTTQRRMDKQWRTLTRLGHHFLDVVQGLPTLRVFGRTKAQVENLRRVGEDLRRTTMGTLRLAFLSSLVLELLATLSVAVVAVSIGLRLVDGKLTLHTALLVLLLAPEAYLPLRAVGTHYHASTEGISAANHVFTVLEIDPPAFGGAQPVPDLSRSTIRVEGLAVSYPGRNGAGLPPTNLELTPGRIVAVTGPSGSGKSTLIAALLGFVTPAEGRVVVGGTDLAQLDLAAWREKVAWVPQRPHLFAGTIADNIRLGRPQATLAEVQRAAELAGAAEFINALADGYAARLGEAGAGLSTGQRRRVALARAFLRDAPVLLLDEPTAGLDADTEAMVADAVRRLVVGRTVLLATHRPALAAIAHEVVPVGAAELVS